MLLDTVIWVCIATVHENKNRFSLSGENKRSPVVLLCWIRAVHWSRIYFPAPCSLLWEEKKKKREEETSPTGRNVKQIIKVLKQEKRWKLENYETHKSHNEKKKKFLKLFQLCKISQLPNKWQEEKCSHNIYMDFSVYIINYIYYLISTLTFL